MDSFWWMCSWSFRLWMRIWRMFGGLLHHLLLMMGLNWPLAIGHKKGEYILMEIWGDFEFLEVWSFRLYLGASWCIYFLWVVYVKGRYFVLCFYFYYCFLFHMCHIGYWFILWGYLWYMSFIFCFVKSRIYFFVLLVFSTHAFMCLLSVSGIYRFIQLCYCLYWQLIDSS